MRKCGRYSESNPWFRYLRAGLERSGIPRSDAGQQFVNWRSPHRAWSGQALRAAPLSSAPPVASPIPFKPPRSTDPSYHKMACSAKELGGLAQVLQALFWKRQTLGSVIGMEQGLT